MRPIKLPHLIALQITIPNSGVLLTDAINTALTNGGKLPVDWEDPHYDGLDALDVQNLSGGDMNVCYDGNESSPTIGNKKIWESASVPLRHIPVKDVHLCAVASDVTANIAIGYSQMGE